MRVGSHVEQPLHVPHLPYLFLPITRVIHQHRMALVDAAGDVGVAAGAEYGGGAGVGVDAGEVVRGQGEAALRVLDCSGVLQEEGAFGFVEMALRSAENEGAELEPGVHIGEERRQLRSLAAVFKVEQAADPPAGGDRLEERGRGLVSADTRGRKQTYYAVRLDQIHGTLDEERVEVDSASAQHRICAGLLDVCSH